MKKYKVYFSIIQNLVLKNVSLLTCFIFHNTLFKKNFFIYTYIKYKVEIKKIYHYLKLNNSTLNIG